MSKILFELYKKAFKLPRDRKEELFNNFPSFVEASVKKKKRKKQIKKILDEDTRLTEEDNPYPPENRNGMFEDRTAILKEARNTHDPETTKEMSHIIDLMKKFISIDQNISYKNLCIFLNPLLKGSRRVSLKNNRIIGLIYTLHKLSKKWESANKRNQKEIRVNFFEVLSLIEKRISEEKPAKRLASRSSFCYRNSNKAYKTASDNVNKMLETQSPQDILRILFYSNSIDFDGKESIIEDLEQMSDESNS